MIGVSLMDKLETDLSVGLHNVTASAIRLNVTYRLTTAQSTDDNTLALGIAWVSDSVLSAGGVALPDPSEDHYDWMAYDARTIAGEGASDTDHVPINGHFQINNDSMRKQRENHSTLCLMVRCTLLQATQIQVFVSGRVLYLLP